MVGSEQDSCNPVPGICSDFSSCDAVSARLRSVVEYVHALVLQGSYMGAIVYGNDVFGSPRSVDFDDPIYTVGLPLFQWMISIS